MASKRDKGVDMGKPPKEIDLGCIFNLHSPSPHLSGHFILKTIQKAGSEGKKLALGEKLELQE